MENIPEINLLKEKVSFANDLLTQLKEFQHIDGVTKLERKIKQEIKFLEKVLKSDQTRTEHLHCSNLSYFSALVKCISRQQNVVHVYFPVMCQERKIHVDIVCNNGATWIKVVARNKKSLAEAVLGDTSHNLRTILDQAEDYIYFAKKHPRMFEVPQVLFEFTGGIEDFLKAELESRGVVVLNAVPDLQNSYGIQLHNKSENNILRAVDVLNLDVTTMLAYISNLCNGHCEFAFKEPLLSAQASWEIKRPVKLVLNKLFLGMKLICCETAKTAFENIVQLIGGPNEKRRAQELLKRVDVLPDIGDADAECVRILNLIDGGRIKHRSKIIFAFGHRNRAITVTANVGFVRAAKQQGVDIAVYLHEARALTEMKEQCGK